MLKQKENQKCLLNIVPSGSHPGYQGQGHKEVHVYVMWKWLTHGIRTPCTATSNTFFLKWQHRHSYHPVTARCVLPGTPWFCVRLFLVIQFDQRRPCLKPELQLPVNTYVVCWQTRGESVPDRQTNRQRTKKWHKNISGGSTIWSNSLFSMLENKTSVLHAGKVCLSHYILSIHLKFEYMHI